MIDTAFRPMMLQPLEGALTTLYVATAPTLEGGHLQGKYFVPIALEHPISAVAENKALQKQLWAVSERLVSTAGGAS